LIVRIGGLELPRPAVMAAMTRIASPEEIATTNGRFTMESAVGKQKALAL